jgi:hypothetical protein
VGPLLLVVESTSMSVAHAHTSTEVRGLAEIA